MSGHTMRHLQWVAVVVILGFSASGLAFSEDLAIVVHKANAISDLSFIELVKIFKQERQQWGDGHKIYLLMRAAGTPEKTLVLSKIYRMRSDGELKKFWLERLFREEIAAFPKVMDSGDSVKEFVSQVPNAIGFVRASEVDERVKVLRLDGKLPGEPSYPLRDSP